MLGEDAYHDLWRKAAALLQSILKNHALVGGNKRLGWLSMATFLEINGVSVTAIPADEVFRFAMGVAAASNEIDELAAEVRRLATR